MKWIFIALGIFPLSCMNAEKNIPEKLSLLCLGDSYTIGEAVAESERFPVQLVDSLEKKNIQFSQPEIIATTGWTTDELMTAIREKNISSTFDFVTLLIGVNNQYRGRDTANYRKEFLELLEKAIQFAGNKKSRVIVLSIPDWGVTPFAEGRDRKKIAEEIDQFNAINREEAMRAGVHYLDITGFTRQAVQEPALTAHDGLHPSGKCYSLWIPGLVEIIENELK